MEAGCNLNAEDIGHVPMNHAIYSGNVAMVEALLSHNVSLCLPELLQDAVLMCQTRERELDSYRTSGVVPSHLSERLKREMLQSSAAGEAAPMSFKAGHLGVSSPSSPQSDAASPASTATNYHNLLVEDLENRVAIVLMLLHANIRVPYNSKPVWLPYLRSHVSFKPTIDIISKNASHVFDQLRASEFANLTRVDLVGACIDDERATYIARNMLTNPNSNIPLLHLNLSRNWIEQRGAMEIGNALSRNSTLLTLNLAHNYIQDCTHMMKGMKDNKTLKTLDLSANRLSSGESIASRLPTMRLTSLNLAMNKLEYRGGSQILKAVLCHPNIQSEEELDPLTFNSSGRSFIATNTDNLSTSSSSGSSTSSNANNNEAENTPVSTLTALNLSSNEIHPYDKFLFSEELVNGLKNNSALTELDLGFNWLSTPDLNKLVISLAHNITLSTLCLRGYAVSEEDLKTWLGALALNHSLTTFIFDHSPPSLICDTIRRHIEKNNLLFSNSHMIHDPIASDSIDAYDPHDDCSPKSDDSMQSASEKPELSASPPAVSGESSPFSAASVSSAATSSTPSKERKHSSSSPSLSSRSRLNVREVIEVKQYGIVRQGDSALDAIDAQSIPCFDVPTCASGSSNRAQGSAARATTSRPTTSSRNTASQQAAQGATLPGQVQCTTNTNPEPKIGQVIEVHAQGRSFRSLPRCVLKYTDVTKLVLQRNNLAALPRAINQLVNLLILDLRCNRLAALPPEIGDLKKMTHLLVSHNKLQFVPIQLTSSPALKHVHLDANPLSLVPPNFRKNIDSVWKKPFAQSELYQYLKSIGSSGEGTFNKGRLMLVGDPAVGKTTIRKMLVRGRAGFSLLDWFSSKPTASEEISVATDGIDIDVVKMSDPDGKKYLFDVWDYAGHEVYYTTHTFFLSPRAVYLLVFNMEQYSPLSIEYWMQSIVFKAGSQAPIYLVGTHPEKLTTEERDALLAQLKANYRGIFVDLVWINPVTGEGVEELKGKICKIAAKRRLVGETVPKSYMRIADQLKATACARPYMPMKELAGIVLSNDVAPDHVDAAVSWLIDVGAVLSYATSNTKSPEQLVFIDPQFLCNVFAQVVSIKYSSTTGRLSKGIIASICRHDLKLQEELFHILTVFDLAYVLQRASTGKGWSTISDPLAASSSAPAVAGSNAAAIASPAPETEVELFVPALLSLTEPKGLSEIWKPSPTMRVYQRHFNFPFLPLGFFSKLLVRCLLLLDVEAKTYWANGLVAVQKRKGRTLASVPNQPTSPPTSPATVQPSSSSSSSQDAASQSQGEHSSKEHPGSENQEEDEMFYLRFEPQKNLLMLQVNADQDGVTLASLVDLILALIQERYPQAELRMTIPVATSPYETVYLDVDELASNIAAGTFVKVIDGKVWHISNFAPDLVLKDLSNLRVNDSDIVKGRRLGEGSFGLVYDATYRGEQCAVKYITRFSQLANQEDYFRTRSSDFANFAHEIRIMNLLKHPNIVRLKGYIPQPVGLLMEYFGSGDLLGLLEGSPNCSWPLRLRIALDIALGMNYLHMLEPPLCHRDLRSPNILLKSTQAESPDPVAKVADFGLTVAVVDRLGYGPTESWRWSAPEVVTASQYTHSSDIWSFGILLLELITAELPYDSLQKAKGKREHEMSSMYANGEFRPEFPDSYDNHPVTPANEQEHNALKMLSQLARHCCMEAPEDRIPFTQIVKHLVEIIDSSGTLKLPESVRMTANNVFYIDEGEDDGYDINDDDTSASEAEDKISSPQTSTPNAQSPHSASLASSQMSLSHSHLSVSSSNAGAEGADETGSGIHLGASSASLSASATSLPSHSSLSSPRLSHSTTTSYELDKTKIFALADRKFPDSCATTAVKISGNSLWIGLENGILARWDVSALTLRVGDEIPAGTMISGNRVTLPLLKSVAITHGGSIRGIVENDRGTKLCIISEDGSFSIVNLENKDAPATKYIAVPGQTAPLLSVISIGDRLYFGTAKGHVVAWSWENPVLLAFWDGMDAQPVCQLFFTRGTKDLVVTYGNSIKFLNIFDLGDTLRQWKPQLASDASNTQSGTVHGGSAAKVALARANSAHSSRANSIHISVESHRKLSSSTQMQGSQHALLYKSVLKFQHNAYLGAAGQHIWTKSGPTVRLWNVGRGRGVTTSSASSSPKASPPSSPSRPAAMSDATHKEGLPQGTSRTNIFANNFSLAKELLSPNADASAHPLVTPIILSATPPGASRRSRSASPHVFILESPTHITMWDVHASSFVDTLENPTQPGLAFEHIFMLGDCLAALSRDQIFVWRPHFKVVPNEINSISIRSSSGVPPPAVVETPSTEPEATTPTSPAEN